VLAEAAAVMRPGADDALMPAVDRVLRDAGVGAGDLAAVVCGAGPGGFTSLRIATAVAKGIAHATGCRLVAAPSLALAAAGRAAEAGPGVGAWLVTLDALRGERYVAEVATAAADGRVRVMGYRALGVRAAALVAAEAARIGGAHVDANAAPPRAAAVRAFDVVLGAAAPTNAGGALAGGALALAPVDLDAWEPDYGRLAEAQARWELTHGRPLASALTPEA
jgi:tRNA threonylcarbamoyladenosine biosynthesis protein TsaB